MPISPLIFVGVRDLLDAGQLHAVDANQYRLYAVLQEPSPGDASGNVYYLLHPETYLLHAELWWLSPHVLHERLLLAELYCLLPHGREAVLLARLCNSLALCYCYMQSLFYDVSVGQSMRERAGTSKACFFVSSWLSLVLASNTSFGYIAAYGI